MKRSPICVAGACTVLRFWSLEPGFASAWCASRDRSARIGERLRERARGIHAAPGDLAGYEFFLLAREFGIGIRSVACARADSLYACCQVRHQKQSVKLYAGGDCALERGAFLHPRKDRIDDC